MLNARYVGHGGFIHNYCKNQHQKTKQQQKQQQQQQTKQNNNNKQTCQQQITLPHYVSFL